MYIGILSLMARESLRARELFTYLILCISIFISNIYLPIINVLQNRKRKKNIQKGKTKKKTLFECEDKSLPQLRIPGDR